MDGKKVAAATAGGGESHGDATDAVAEGAAENSCRIGAGARKAADGTLRNDEVMVLWRGGGEGAECPGAKWNRNHWDGRDKEAGRDVERGKKGRSVKGGGTRR